MELDEAKANQLCDLMHAAGVPEARVHWDRSPWGISIPLTDDHDEYAPRLYVLTELMPVDDRGTGIYWHGSVGGLDEFEELPVLAMHENDIHFEFIDRNSTESLVGPIIATWALLSAGLRSILEAA